MTMLERAAAVEAVDTTTIQLRLAPTCSGCGGCGGRCGLFGSHGSGGETIELPRSCCDDDAPRVGDAVRVYLPSSALLVQARLGYGAPLLGLLAGALAAHGVASLLNLPPDLAAIGGAAAGTLSGLALSKRAMPLPCRIGRALESSPCTSDARAAPDPSPMHSHEEHP